MVTAWTGDSPPPIYSLNWMDTDLAPTLEDALLYSLTVEWTQIWTHERTPTITRTRSRVSIDLGLWTDGFPSTPPHLGWLPFKVAGVVVDQNEDPISGADVYLLRGTFPALSLVQKTTSEADGSYIFYVEDPGDQFTVISWKWDAGLGEYIKGVTDRDLQAVAC